MRKLLFFLIIFSLITASLYSSVTLNDSFKISFSKEGVSSFYFSPSEVIAFHPASESNTVAKAEFTVNWKLYIDDGFKLTLEACAYNVDTEEDNYCLMHSNGIIGLNYLMEMIGTNKTAGDDNNQNKLSRAARTLIIAENAGSNTLPLEGSQEIELIIPYPTYEGDVAVNGVYTGYLILTLTHN